LAVDSQSVAEALERFVALTRWEVESRMQQTLARSRYGVTWLGLWNLMQRQGYIRVADLGRPAATSWAIHLGVIPGSPETERAPRPEA
jgi:hypothetical protein